ncbi:MAG: hypothetical protein NC320_03245 [Clostridium sp.]|nr:hypothetical protein [Clostridium sp.]
MITYGYAKGYHYTNDGTLLVQVRVPSIHGAYDQSNYMGKSVKNYTLDNDLPWYPSVLLPHLPNEGEVVALSSMNTSNNDFIVIGLTGGSYQNGATNLKG